ncbi:PRC-barrel domain-containing protein [Methylobacterium durans]|uniref:PRC-barrel domain-containing protein n=1 Tax=Methylobacterium durans TaxID=2202825 RepID=UPI002AFDEEFA|nr:PRC-barrel domain-containing protein [Methylobacterium durans]MEA1833142.1 PRC-barrel domain-containing protein [Methylobacterium durans]
MAFDDVGLDARSDAVRAANLIASDRVEGTDVRRSDGSHVGTIARLMIDKPSGHVVYAILNLAAAPDRAEQGYALPWRLLRYSTALSAYELDITDAQLHAAPRNAAGRDEGPFDRAWEEHVHSYFNTEPYWESETGRATDVPFGKDRP